MALPQITIEYITNFIKENEIKLTSTHHKLCVPIINRLCQKMWSGIKFDEIKECEGLIIDGHHRYLSSLITKIEVGVVPSHKTSATVQYNWVDIEFDENDWDTDSKISYLNELDAKYNGIDLERIKEIISIKK